MEQMIQDTLTDIIQSILKIDINAVDSIRNFHIFTNDLSAFFPIWKHLFEMEKNNEFCIGTYYCIHTSFQIFFTILPLEERAGKISKYWIIGPYLPENFTDQLFEQICRENHVTASSKTALRAFYTVLPMTWEKQIEAVASAILRRMFQIKEPAGQIHFLAPDSPIGPKQNPTDSFSIASKILEERYRNENLLLSAIRRGDEPEALRLVDNWSSLNILPRPKNLIRSWKNLVSSTNTLFRKATEMQDVHPFYLDQISRKFALKIEAASTMPQIDCVLHDMVHGYCKLVKKYSLSQYSKTVQTAINMIHLELTQPLSLNLIANRMNLTPEYLSRLFKKELGTTLTDYIHKRQCECAADYLVNTDLSVGRVGEQAGISDSSYFSSLFRRQYGMTPTQYRKKHKEGYLCTRPQPSPDIRESTSSSFM